MYWIDSESNRERKGHKEHQEIFHTEILSVLRAFFVSFVLLYFRDIKQKPGSDPGLLGKNR
jgi:hypothetical protein